MAATVVNSLREDASRGGGSLLPSPIRARLSLSPCVSPLSLLPLAPVNWCVGAGWTQITREEFGLSNPRWSCAPLSPLPRSLLLSFALFPVSSLIFLSSFLLLPSCSSSYIYIRFPFLLANNNIFPTNIRSRDFNFFLFFFYKIQILVVHFLKKKRFSSFLFEVEREIIIESGIFTIDCWYRSSGSVSPIDSFAPLSDSISTIGTRNEPLSSRLQEASLRNRQVAWGPSSRLLHEKLHLSQM